MKLVSINTRSLPLVLTLLCLFIFSCGCNNSTESESNKHTSTESVEKKGSAVIKTPGIDFHAAVISDDIEAIKQHILAGSDLNQKEPFGGSSPLISAALFGKPKTVEVLLDAGAELDFQNNDGSTALHTAAFFCRPEIVTLLLEKGANKAIKNNHGDTAYDTVAGSFEEVQPIYDMFGQSLAPFGLVLDDDYLKTTRPEVAALLE